MAKRKRLNKRAVILLTVMGGVILIGVVMYALQRIPRDPNTYLRVAEQYRKDAKLNEALRYYNQAVDNAVRGQSPDRYLIYYKRGEFLLDWTRFPTLNEAERTEKYSQAVKDLQLSMTYRPNTDAQKLLFDLAWQQNYYAFRRQDIMNPPRWDRVIAEAERLIQLDPNDSSAYARRAFANAQQAKMLKDKNYSLAAEKDYRKAMEINPADMTSRSELADFLVEMHRFTDAEEVYTQGLDVNPDHAKLRIDYAGFLRSQGRQDAADEQITYVIAHHPTSAAGYIAKAKFAIMDRNWDEAVKALDSAIQVDPTSLESYFYKAQIIQQQRQRDLSKVAAVYRAGLAAIARQVESRPTSQTEGILDRRQIEAAREELNDRLANVLLDQAVQVRGEERAKLLAEAKECAEKVAKGDNPFRQKLLGRIAVAENRPLDAMKCLELANAKFGGNDLMTASMLVDLYLGQGSPGKAQAMLKDIVRHQGVSQAALWLIHAKIATQILRDYDEAAKDVAKALAVEPENSEALTLQQALTVARSPEPQVPADLEITPDVARILMDVAETVWANGDTERAIAILQAIYQKDSENLAAISRLHSMFLSLQQTERAKQLLQDVLKAHPDNRRIKDELSIMDEKDPNVQIARRLELIDKDSELNDFRKAMEKANICAKAGQMGEYARYLRLAVDLDPKSAAAVERLLTVALAKKGKDAVLIEKCIDLAREGDLDQAQGHVFAARVALAEGDWAKAKAQAEESLKVTPELKTAQVILAECLLRGGASVENRTRAEGLLRSVLDRDPSNIGALLLMSQLSAALGNTAEHEELIRRLAVLMPQDPYVSNEMTQILMNAKTSPDVLIPRLEKKFNDERESGSAVDMQGCLRLAELYRKTNQGEKSRALAEFIYKSSTDAAFGAAALSEHYLWAGRTAEIDKIFQHLIETYPDKVRAYVLYADFIARYDSSSAYSMSEKALEAASGLDPKDDRGYLALSALYARQRKWAEAAQALNKAVSIKPANVEAKRLMARYKINARAFVEASAILEDLIKANPSDAEAITFRGMLELRQNDLVKAKADLDDAINKAPKAYEPLQLRAQISALQGDPAMAKKDLQKAQTLTANPEVAMQLADLHRKLNERNQALVLYQEILKSKPDYEPAYAKLVDLYLDLHQDDKLRACLIDAKKAFPKNPAFPMYEAKMYERLDDKIHRLAALAEAFQIAPRSEPILEGYLQALLDAGQYDTLLTVSGDYVKWPGLGPRVVAYRAAAVARKGEADRADELFRAALKDAGRIYLDGVTSRMIDGYGMDLAIRKIAAWAAEGKADDWRLFFGLGLLQRKASEKDPAALSLAVQALTKAEGLATDDREKAEVDSVLGGVCYAMRDLPRAEKCYRSVLAVNPSDVGSLNNLAYLLTEDRGDANAALPYIKRALELVEDEPDVMDTYGWTLAKAGDFAQAEQVLLRATQIREPSETLRYHLGYVYEQTDRLSEAMKLYREALEMMKRKQADPVYNKVSEAVKRVQASLRSGK